MSQNRQARLSERRNHLDLQINLLAEQENTQMLHLLRKICEKLDVEVDRPRSLNALEQATEPEHVVNQIEQIVEKRCGENGKEKGKDAKKVSN